MRSTRTNIEATVARPSAPRKNRKSSLEQARMFTGTCHDAALPTLRGPIEKLVRGADPLRPKAPFDTDRIVRNELLSALPAGDLAQLSSRLERVPLKRRQFLQERNLPVTHAYFIERGGASLLSRAGEGETVEVGTLGAKDLAGVPIVLGTARSPHRCVVQVPGEALRIRADHLTQAMNDLSALRKLLLRYVQAAMVQSAQLVVCSTKHALHERLARWLLVAQDRLGGNEVPLTHQVLSRALGVRRATVTTAIGRMEEAGLVRRGRGRLVILDGAGLERASCECYRAIRAEHQHMLHAAGG
jgi:CRP-like cAMP-binding protein